MSNLDVLREICDNGGRLQEVWQALFEGSTDFVTEMKFCFENSTVIVSADSEYDTIVLRTGDFTENKHIEKTNVSVFHPWVNALNLEMRWGWELINHQGYSDGLRIEFANPDTDTSLAIELIVVASSLHLYTCSRQSRD